MDPAHPPQPILPTDSAVTKAEQIERNGADAETGEPASKRVKLQAPEASADHGEPAAKKAKLAHPEKGDARDQAKGIAAVKAE